MGLALGCRLLNLPWHVTGVILAEQHDAYVQRANALLADAASELQGTVAYSKVCPGDTTYAVTDDVAGAIPASCQDLPLSWVPRRTPRPFGKVYARDVEACRQVGRTCGVLLDPVYSLAGWEVAEEMAGKGAEVVYWHQGGGLGLFGMAQRMPDAF